MSDLCPVLWCFLFRAPLDLVLPCVCPYLITFLFLAQFVSSCVIILFTFSILKPCVFLSLTSSIKVDVVFLCVSALPCVPRFGYWIKDCYFVFTPHLLASLVLFRDSMQMSKIKKKWLMSYTDFARHAMIFSAVQLLLSVFALQACPHL